MRCPKSQFPPNSPFIFLSCCESDARGESRVGLGGTTTWFGGWLILFYFFFFAQGGELLLSGRATSGKKAGGCLWIWGSGEGAGFSTQRGGMKSSPGRALRGGMRPPAPRPLPAPLPPGLCPPGLPPFRPFPAPRTAPVNPGGDKGGRGRSGVGGLCGRCPLGHCFFSL